MKSRLSAAALAAILLTSCTHLPPTAVPDSAAPSYSGALNAGTPLIAIIRDKNIQPLDPESSVSLLDQATVALAKTDPDSRYRGVTYSLSKSNALSLDWLAQTPRVWDSAAADVVANSHAAEIPKRMGKMIASARRSVDVTTLQPFPDGQFLAALHDGIAALARSGRAVSVRILVGQYPPGTIDPKKFIASLADAVQSRGSRVSLYVAVMRSCTAGADCTSFSWNHAKIVSIDGRTALVGGENMYALNYLGDDPVFDVSMQLTGPAAADASRFADAEWQFVCANNGKLSTVEVASLLPGSAAPGLGCLPTVSSGKPGGGIGGVPVLAVGRLASGITQDFANQSDLARDLMLGAARHSIRIVQQDIGFTLGRPDTLYPESTLEKLADFLLRDTGDVFIVLSNLDAVGKAGDSYSNGVPVETIARKLYDVAHKRSLLAEAALTDLLCRRLHIAPLRFGPDAKWPDGKPFANHAKSWVVDDRYFYIGSDNFYPIDLQEFGYIVDSTKAAADYVKAYWAPLWQWSKGAAVSGDDASDCVLRHKPLRAVGEKKISAK